MKKINFFILFFFLGSLSAARAEEVQTLTLKDALKLAHERNVEMIMADERVKQAVAKKGEAFSVVLPQLSVEASQTRQTRNLGSMGIPLTSDAQSVVGPFNSFDARLRVTQMLFDQAALQRLFTVDALYKLSQAEYHKAEQDVMALVAALYLDAVRGQERVELLKTMFLREKKRLWIAHRSWRSGRIKALERKSAKASFKESLAGFSKSRTDARESKYDLLLALGIPYSQDVLLDEGGTLRENKIPTQDEISLWLKNHPERAVSQRALEEKERERNIFIAEYLPRVSAFADVGFSGNEPDGSEKTYTYGVQGSWAILEGGQRGHKIEGAESAVRSAKAQSADKDRQLDAKSKIAAEMLKQTSDNLKAKDLKFSWASEQLQNTDLKFKNGSASEWDLLNDHVEEALTKDERSEAVAAYLLAKVQFFHSFGKIEALFNS